jgi:alanine dehydrogenase
MLVLSEKEVVSLLDWEEIITALEQAHSQYSGGRAVMPVRLVTPVPEINGRITSMPGYLSDNEALGMKVVTYFPNNPRLGLPIILATIMLYSAESGKLVAVMDGTSITTARTACASAMATRRLANPETPVLGVLGAGVQARAHIRALTKVRNIAQVKIFDVAAGSAMRLKKEIEREVGVEIKPVESAQEAVENSDLLVTVTTAKEPILKAAWLKPGVHINAIGSHRPDLREIDAMTMASAKIFVDSREAVMAECGDILLAIQENAITADRIHAEIGEVLLSKKPGRTATEERTLYKAVGIAIQDVATASLVYHKALQQNVGTKIEI